MKWAQLSACSCRASLAHPRALLLSLALAPLLATAPLRQIFVKSQSTITLGVEPTDTVDGVKQMIQAREVRFASLYLSK